MAQLRRPLTCERSWIAEREAKGDGKGRPTKALQAHGVLDDIIGHCEELKRIESSQAMQSIQKLKEITAA
jgi:predicted transcriptional regulator